MLFGRTSSQIFSDSHNKPGILRVLNFFATGPNGQTQIDRLVLGQLVVRIHRNSDFPSVEGLLSLTGKVIDNTVNNWTVCN